VSQDRCGKQDCGVTQILVEVSNLFSVQVFSKLPHRTFSGLVRRIHYSWEWNFLCRFGLQPERLLYCSSSDRSACSKSALYKPALVVLNDLIDQVMDAQAQQSVGVCWLRRLNRTLDKR
jgi:hypothetical protein